MARVIVAVDGDRIAGFYSLSMISIALEGVPAELARKLPRYPDVPAALIGRLGRADRLRGRGVGELLVFDALRRILDASRSIAAFAIIVDAEDERAESFYAALGFMRFPTRPGRLFMLAETAAEAMARVDAAT